MMHWNPLQSIDVFQWSCWFHGGIIHGQPKIIFWIRYKIFRTHIVALIFKWYDFDWLNFYLVSVLSYRLISPIFLPRNDSFAPPPRTKQRSRLPVSITINTWWRITLLTLEHRIGRPTISQILLALDLFYKKRQHSIEMKHWTRYEKIWPVYLIEIGTANMQSISRDRTLNKCSHFHCHYSYQLPFKPTTKDWLWKYFF